MGANTKIEWTDATWNPVRGCSRISEGCRNCYAEAIAARFSGPGQPYEGLAVMKNGEPRWTGEIRLISKHLEDPLRWKKPRKIFVNSMSDLFHEAVPDDYIVEVFLRMGRSERHTFQVLTKRPERMLAWMKVQWMTHRHQPKPLPNVWLGVSVEDQKTADERIPLLLKTPAAVRWISAEPLLGPIDLERTIPCGYYCDESVGHVDHGPHGNLGHIDWVVVGGESGSRARPMHPDWARSLRDQCQSAGVPFFFKQWGEFGWRNQVMIAGKVQPGMARIGKKEAGRLLDGREWKEFPL